MIPPESAATEPQHGDRYPSPWPTGERPGGEWLRTLNFPCSADLSPTVASVGGVRAGKSSIMPAAWESAYAKAQELSRETGQRVLLWDPLGDLAGGVVVDGWGR